MRIIKKNIGKDNSGSVVLQTDDIEDMWYAYNLICKGDHVRAATLRRVQKESATGLRESERKRVILTIHVSHVDFDPTSGSLRVSGRNIVENPFVKVYFIL
jgi:protein pelota